jgi:hypothetical protein
MGALAHRLGEDEHRWALAGLFHDLDQDRTGEDSSRHAYLAADRDRDDPGTRVVYYESPAAVARYAEPTATGHAATRWTPATDATIEVRYPASTPTWQQLGLQVTGPGGAACRSAPTGLAFAINVTPGPARQAGGDLRGHDRWAVPGVGDSCHRGRRDPSRG